MDTRHTWKLTNFPWKVIIWNGKAIVVQVSFFWRHFSFQGKYTHETYTPDFCLPVQHFFQVFPPQKIKKMAWLKIPSLKLTVRTWKWMVGIRSFPFGARPIFRGFKWLVSGRLVTRLTNPQQLISNKRAVGIPWSCLAPWSCIAPNYKGIFFREDWGTLGNIREPPSPWTPPNNNGWTHV